MGTPTAAATTSFAHRTPDQLERGMVIIVPGHTQHETVRRTKLVAGRWIVRTNSNLHRLHPRTRVVLIAESVPGIGYVTALLRDLVDGDECRLDHHGYCQTHGWLAEVECPHSRAKRVLGAS